MNTKIQATQSTRRPICLEELQLGMRCVYTRDITTDIIEQFADVSGDCNPVHVDDVYAKETIFDGRIAHGMLTASFISSVLGNNFPGNGTIYRKQTLEFVRPVRPGDTVTIEIVVSAIDRKERLVTLSTKALVQGRAVLTGEAVVMPPRKHT